MEQKSIIIIGAGIAGLSSGCYGEMNGYRTKIFELHNKPGGVCTAWKRKGYIFDFCIHNLGGSGKSSRFHRIWEELGPAHDLPMMHYEEFVRIERSDGRAFNVFTDIDRLEQHMKELAPGDASVINKFTRAVRLFTHFDMWELQMGGIRAAIRMLPMVWALFRWRGITLQDFAARFSDPFLRQAFPFIHYDSPEIPVILTFYFLAGMHKHDLGWPRGGSLAFSRAIEKRYLDLGGEIYYKSRVEKILVENNRAVGIRLADGTEHRADIVVSSADGHTTIFDMLEGKYVNDQILSYYSAAPASQPFALHVFLGVARDFSREPHAIVLLLDQSVTIAGKVRERLDVELFNFDPSMAPDGKSVIKVPFDSSYAFWKGLYDRYEDYQAEKDRVASAVINLLEKRFPGIKEQIEVVDVTTPVTIERYMGTWQGLQVWWPTEKAGAVMRKGLSRTLPGLGNFYMAGQWAEAMVGLSSAAESGRNLIKTLCKRDKKPFLTKIPGT